jgi:hypothetical protein
MNAFNFYNPYIIYTEPDILAKISIENLIQNKFINEITTCSKCGFFNGVVFDINQSIDIIEFMII